MLAVSAGLMLTSLALAGWHDTWLEALLIGGSALAVPLLMSRAMPHALATRLAYGMGFMIFAALLIH